MNRISRRQFLKISAAMAAGGLLAACQPPATSDGSQPTAIEPTKPGDSTLPVIELEPTESLVVAPIDRMILFDLQPTVARDKSWPLGDVPRNRTLVCEFPGAPPAGNFGFFGNFTHQNGSALLLEPCAYYNVLGDKEVLWLAESYAYNEDATTLVVTFRKGIEWSDGYPFTAEDAAWSIETLKRVGWLNRDSNVKASVASAEAIDDYTLKISFSQPNWRFFYDALTFRFDRGDYTAIQPKHYWADIPDEKLYEDRFYDVNQGWPITTAAYGVGDSTDQYTNYDVRPSWWALKTGFAEREPDIWRVRQVRYSDDNTAAQQLLNKDIDSAYDLRPSITASVVQQGEHLSTWTGRNPPYGNVDSWPISVQFCTAKPPLNDYRVRWAIAYAINQQEVVDVAWGGAGAVAYSPFPAFPRLDEFMAGIKDVTDLYNVLVYNLDYSAYWMTEAGFTRNPDGYWVDANGNLPDFDLYAAVPLFADIAPVIVEQLNKAGFYCKHQSPQDVWAAMVDGRASLFLYGHSGGTIDPVDTFMLYRKENAAPLGEESWMNVTRWYNDEFSSITDTMKSTAMDSSYMKDLFYQAMKIWYSELPDCPLVQWYHRVPVSNEYFGNWPSRDNPYMNSALWHLTAPVVVRNLRPLQDLPVLQQQPVQGSWSVNTMLVDRTILFENVRADLTPRLIPLDEYRITELSKKSIRGGTLTLISVSVDVEFFDTSGNLRKDITSNEVIFKFSYQKELENDYEENKLVPVYFDSANNEWVPFDNYKPDTENKWMIIYVSQWGDRSCGYGTE